MTDLYENLINTIEKSTKSPKTFLRDNDFWNEMMKQFAKMIVKRSY